MDHGHSASPALSGLWIHAPIDRATTRSLARGRADLAEIGAVRCGSADRVECGAADDQVEIGAVRLEWVVARRADLRACLPPAMLADDDAGVEVAVEPGAGTHTAFRGLDRHPVAIGDAARPRRLRMKLHFGMRGAFAQAG